MEESGGGLMEAESNNELSYGSSNVVKCVCVCVMLQTAMLLRIQLL